MSSGARTDPHVCVCGSLFHISCPYVYEKKKTQGKQRVAGDGVARAKGQRLIGGAIKIDESCFTDAVVLICCGQKKKKKSQG